MDKSKHIIGVDFATKPKNVGVAMAEYRNGLALRDVQAGGNSFATVLQWLKQSLSCGHDVLLAIDAPLGWPRSLGTALVPHRAGDSITLPADRMFSRTTDTFVHKVADKKPLEVGADRIARTALAALKFLARLRSKANLEIPLAWSPADVAGVSVIEVYPAATLKAHGMELAPYKKASDDGHRKQRTAIFEMLQREMRHCESHLSIALRNADALDAVVCALAAADFLRDQACPPHDRSVAQAEGWIWTKQVNP